MKTHSNKGEEILQDITMIQNLKAGAAEHHERWDGKGYINGISGKDITLEARIIAIADAYDAMSSNRSYRKAISKEDILMELKKCSGFQFDPQITSVVVEMMEKNQFSSIDVDKILGLNKGN
jgi:HD-GYP domain-containing protein (c-di-GMP phosphodiesterase class II)